MKFYITDQTRVEIENRIRSINKNMHDMAMITFGIDIDKSVEEKDRKELEMLKEILSNSAPIKQENMNYNNIIIDFFTGMRGIHDLFESIYEGLYGGVQRYKVEPNEGIFDKDFLIKFIKINQGNNDFDYELGRIGYRFLTSDEGLKELSKFYLEELKTYKHEYVSTEVIENCKKSLTNIINT